MEQRSVTGPTPGRRCELLPWQFCQPPRGPGWRCGAVEDCRSHPSPLLRSCWWPLTPHPSLRASMCPRRGEPEGRGLLACSLPQGSSSHHLLLLLRRPHQSYWTRRSGHLLDSILLTFHHLGFYVKSAFSTNAQSGFDGVLGPARLALHT